MALEDKVVDIIVDKLGVTRDQVKPEASLIEDLGADSIDTVDLVMTFEEEFGESIPDEDSQKLKTVGDILAYLKSTGKESPSPPPRSGRS